MPVPIACQLIYVPKVICLLLVNGATDSFILFHFWHKIEALYEHSTTRVPVFQLNQAQNRWKHKKIGWCGMSIPAGSGATGRYGYVSILEKTLACSIDNQSVASSGMVWAGNREKSLGATVVELRTANADTLQSYELKLVGKNYDLLIIDHGYNDRDYDLGKINDAVGAMYYGSMNRMLTALLHDNPRLPILLTTPPSLYTPHVPASGSGKLNLHTVAIRNANLLLAKKWGIRVCDLSYASGINAKTVEHEVPDGIHPGDSVHLRFAQVLCRCMNGY